MRRINLGFNPAQYYPVRVPTAEALARLLVAMTVSANGMPIEMTKRDVAADFRLLRLRPALSLLMCTEVPGVHFNVAFWSSAFLPGNALRSEWRTGDFRDLWRCHFGKSFAARKWIGQIGSLRPRSLRDYMSTMDCSLT